VDFYLRREKPVSRQGFTRRWRQLNVVQPAVGTDWVFINPGETVLRVVSLVARLTTDANVANRTVTLVADNQTRATYRQEATVVQINGVAHDYAAHTGMTQTPAAPTVRSFGLPAEGLLLLPGHRLSVTTANIQAGDQWSLIGILADEVPTDSAYMSTQGRSAEETTEG